MNKDVEEDIHNGALYSCKRWTHAFHCIVDGTRGNNEISQREKIKYWMISFIRGLKESREQTVNNDDNF